jgi:hypothetical protein
MELKSKLIYPNPFKPVGVEFYLSEDAGVTLKIFDMDGKEIETVLDNAPMKSGKHAVVLKVQEYQDGVYMYRLSVKNGDNKLIETKKIIVAK